MVDFIVPMSSQSVHTIDFVTIDAKRVHQSELCMHACIYISFFVVLFCFVVVVGGRAIESLCPSTRLSVYHPLHVSDFVRLLFGLYLLNRSTIFNQTRYGGVLS